MAKSKHRTTTRLPLFSFVSPKAVWLPLCAPGVPGVPGILLVLRCQCMWSVNHKDKKLKTISPSVLSRDNSKLFSNSKVILGNPPLVHLHWLYLYTRSLSGLSTAAEGVSTVFFQAAWYTTWPCVEADLTAIMTSSLVPSYGTQLFGVISSLMFCHKLTHVLLWPSSCSLAGVTLSVVQKCTVFPPQATSSCTCYL